MFKPSLSSVLLGALLAAEIGAPRCLAQTTVSVCATASHTIPTTLYGQMFEDISSGDGGLYAELIQNRAFQQVTPDTSDALDPWVAINGADLTVVADTDPVSSTLPNALSVVVPSDATGSVGFSNPGYYGINVNTSWTYNASLYYRFPTSSPYSGTLTVGLEDSSGDTLVSNSTTISGTQNTWTQVALALSPTTAASDIDNSFFVTVDGAEAAGETIYFTLISLFPPTYKDRPNGMRIDIAEALAATKPGFFRFPGGNNIGTYIETRWQWNATVGSLLDRPGRLGDWDYINTEHIFPISERRVNLTGFLSGIGLYEYLVFLEDVGMEPIMAVWSGYSLDGDSVAEDDLGLYIQQAIDQIEFAIGDSSTSSAAAIRAEMGHPDPFNLTYVEIGNEDFFASSTYEYRWPAFYGNLSAAFPDLSFIATTYPFDPILDPTPGFYDVHVYETPDWFIDNAFYYDSFERNGTKYFEGEYACEYDNSGSVNTYPTMEGASAEAAFMTGLERNSDIVFAASYAPTLQLINYTSWTPNLVTFTQGKVVLSTSYYVQQLFSLNVGDQYIPSTLPTSDGSLYWSISLNSTTGDLFIKIANPTDAESDVTFDLAFDTVASTGTLQALTGGADDSNTVDAPNTVVPSTSSITTGQTFDYTTPAYSVSVITVAVS